MSDGMPGDGDTIEKCGVMYDVLAVDHGNIFNTGHWYTFYCPHCRRQINKMGSSQKCQLCDKKLKWKSA